jgi:EpsI family protein
MVINPNTVAHWRIWLVLGLACVSLYVGFAAAWDKLLPRWEGAWDYSHGYLVCGMIAWLLFERIRGQPLPSLTPSVPGLIALTAIAALYAVLQVLDLTIGMFVMLPLVLLGILWAMGGMALLRAGAAPALLLVFAIPFWDRLGPLLQDLATVVVRDMLRAVGIHAFSEGHVIRTARAAVEVAAACSGMTFLLASLTLTSFYSVAWLRSWRRGLLLAFAGVVVAIVSNWLRIFIITVAGHMSDMQHYLIVQDHEFFGWALFSVFMVVLILFARRLEVLDDVRAPPLDRAKQQGAAAAQTASAESQPTSSALQAGWSRRSCVVVGLALVVIIAPVLVRPLPVAERAGLQMSIDAGPEAAWRPTAPADDWSPESPNPAAILRQSFARSGEVVDVYLAYYPVQAPGGKVTSTAHRIAPGWGVGADRRVAHAGRWVREQELVQNDQRRLVWSWFHMAGSRVPSLFQAKLHELQGLLTGDRSGAWVAVSTTCAETCVDAGLRLEAFLTISEEALHHLSDTNPVVGL